MNPVQLRPVGIFHCSARYPEEAPRQGCYTECEGVIELESRCNFEAALEDMRGIERIWIVYLFDRNANWKPKVLPPVGPPGRRIGVFATRSPHRPCPIGITAARLIAVDKLKLTVRGHDLLTGTPVLDIKPYIPAADSFPDSACGWLDETPPPVRSVDAVPSAVGELDFLAARGVDLRNVARVQLAIREPDSDRQRIVWREPGKSGSFAFRTWRFDFEYDEARVVITGVHSGYGPDELIPGASDIYHDKVLHRDYLEYKETHDHGTCPPVE